MAQSGRRRVICLVWLQADFFGKSPIPAFAPSLGITTMRYLVSVMLVIVGVIHLLPLSGVLGSEKLAALYGLPFEEPNLLILMRHRAVLFGLLGGFLLFAAFSSAYQTAALVAGLISVVSFLGLAWPVAAANAQLARVFSVDLLALACLVVGAAAQVYLRSRG
jgi:hypothetical protein